MKQLTIKGIQQHVHMKKDTDLIQRLRYFLNSLRQFYMEESLPDSEHRTLHELLHELKYITMPLNQVKIRSLKEGLYEDINRMEMQINVTKSNQNLLFLSYSQRIRGHKDFTLLPLINKLETLVYLLTEEIELKPTLSEPFTTFFRRFF